MKYAEQALALAPGRFPGASRGLRTAHGCWPAEESGGGPWTRAANSKSTDPRFGSSSAIFIPAFILKEGRFAEQENLARMNVVYRKAAEIG
jgi:hypothetical protein